MKQYIRLKISAIEHDIAVAKAVGNNELCNSLMSYFADDINMDNVANDYMDLMEADDQVEELYCSLDGAPPVNCKVITKGQTPQEGDYFYIQVGAVIILYRLIKEMGGVFNFSTVRDVLNNGEINTLF